MKNGGHPPCYCLVFAEASIGGSLFAGLKREWARICSTRVNYNMIVEPGFVVPPLIGSRIVKQKLRKDVLIAVSRIERIARIRNEKGGESNLTLQENLLRRIPNEHNSAN